MIDNEIKSWEQKFEETAEKLEALKEQQKELYAELDVLYEGAKLGVMFQGSNGCVYRVIEPKGEYVYFRKFSYERTKKSHEKAGTLAKKTAEEAGFIL
jgi:hypothetical protein